MTTTYPLKQPCVPDLSATDVGSLYTSSTKPAGVIMRATYALYPNLVEHYLYAGVTSDRGLRDVYSFCRKNAIPFGAYAYILQGSIEKQAQAFIDACKLAGILVNGAWNAEYPPAADVEVEAVFSGKPPNKNFIKPISGLAWAAQIKVWLDMVEKATGVKPMIYTARPQWKWLCAQQAIGGNLTFIPPSWTSQYEFWIKYYPYLPGKVDSLPDMALPTGVQSRQVVLWQYEEAGRSKGFDYNDLNVLVGVGVDKYGPNSDPQPVPVETLGHLLEGDALRLGDAQLFNHIQALKVNHPEIF